MLIAKENEKNVFVFVPRAYDKNVKVFVLDENMNPKEIQDFELEFKKGYAFLSFDYSFTLGSVYKLYISNALTNEPIFKTEIKCTNLNNKA